MLWLFTNTNKHGHLRSRVVHTEGALTVRQGFGSFIGAKRFRYESRTPYHGLTEVKGKKYLTPDWIEVHPQTTYSDIVYNAPVVEEPKEKSEWMFASSSGDGFYQVRQNGLKITCNCPGAWRAKDRKCKHIKQVESGKA